MLDKLFFIHDNTLKDTPVRFKRYLYGLIDWKSRAICVTGARGTGKTTLLLQYMAEHYNNSQQALYVSADNVEVSAEGLYKIAGDYFSYGGKALVIDEVHKYPGWQIELKNILDTFKDKKVIVSGSSSIDLKQGKADLSRRFAYYDLKGMSFGEYLALVKNISVEPQTIGAILADHVKISHSLLKHGPILKYFNDYLSHGYYPFITEGEPTYLQKILSVIEKVFYEDIAVIGNLKRNNITALKKLLWVIATSSPFEVNIDRMSRDIGISKEYIYTYLEYLEDAGLLSAVYGGGKGYKLVRKPAKLFVENTNLLVALCGSLRTESEIGTMRETFFVNQLQQSHKVTASPKGDFLIDNKYTFEIGGKDKGFEQLAGISNSYIAADRLEIGHAKKIPLYLFGLLY